MGVQGHPQNDKFDTAFFGCLFVVCFVLPCLVMFLLFGFSFEIYYLNWLKQGMREVSRSRIYISLIAASLPVSISFIGGYLSGWQTIKGKFINAIKGSERSMIFHYRWKDLFASGNQWQALYDEIISNKFDAYLFLPFPNDTSDSFYKKRCILIPYLDRHLINYLLKHGLDIDSSHEITSDRHLVLDIAYKAKRRAGLIFTTGLITTVGICFGAMIMKNYYALTLRADDEYIFLFLFLDILLLAICFVIGYFLGRGNFKRKMTCNWYKSDLCLVGGCLCVRASGYIYICPVDCIRQFSTEEANKVYQTHNSMR